MYATRLAPPKAFHACGGEPPAPRTRTATAPLVTANAKQYVTIKKQEKRLNARPELRRRQRSYRDARLVGRGTTGLRDELMLEIAASLNVACQMLAPSAPLLLLCSAMHLPYLPPVSVLLELTLQPVFTHRPGPFPLQHRGMAN